MAYVNAINHSLADNGSVPTRSDPCVYVYKSNDSIVMFLLHVDDVLPVGSNTELKETLMVRLL